MSDKLKHLYEFEDFRLDSKNPGLWRDGRAVSISPKALETLILLIEKQNEVVTRDDLLDTIWKDTFVEEGNINYTISLLRKTLGNKDLIQTVPRRGYRFVGAVRNVPSNGGEKIVEPAVREKQTENEIFPLENVKRRNGGRWIFVSVAVIFAIFVSSFAYFRQDIRASKQAESPLTANHEAQAAFTRGRMILARRSVEKREEKAIDEFQNAVTLDPTFAAGYAGLSEAFLSHAVKQTGKNSFDGYAKARVAAEKSLALDANLSEGYLARGWVKRQADWDWAGAESDLRHAIQLDEKNAKAHQRLALLLCNIGRLDEALAESKIAYELDPVSDYIVGARFPILEARREYAEALKEAEALTRENKSNNSAQRAYATFLYHTGDYRKVIELGEDSMTKNPSQTPFAWTSLMQAAYHKTNQFDKAEENLKRLETLAQTDTKAAYSLAMNYAELDRADEALMLLQRCFDEKEERSAWMKVEPRFENLRRDPRFAELLGKIRLAN